MPMTDIELLDIEEVYAIPGVIQSGNRPLPQPFWTLRSSNGAKHMFWLRGDIERWLASTPAPTLVQKITKALRGIRVCHKLWEGPSQPPPAFNRGRIGRIDGKKT